MPTPTAYKALDRKYNNFANENSGGTADFSEFYDALESDFASKMYNVFECVTLAECPSTAKIKKIMLENGALGSLMSGSGPSAFGIFEDIKDAEKAAEAVKNQGFFCKICRPVGKY